MSDERNLLASLEAHGMQFLARFSDLGTKREEIQDDESLHFAPEFSNSTSSFDGESTEGWTGFASANDFGMDLDEVPVGPLLDGHSPNVVVFCEGTSTLHTPSKSKSQNRSFMSSKVSKLKESSKMIRDNSRDIEYVDSEVSNTHNDVLLHRLVHAQLLSGSPTHELNMTAAQRRKALAGRVQELAGDSKLGKGESDIRQDERKKASKRVRDGMMAKQKERNFKLLTEAKAAGNYHPTLKRLFSASSITQPRKRNRGLKTGIGRFSGGMLKLTPEEIGSIPTVQTARDRGSSRKRRQ